MLNEMDSTIQNVIDKYFKQRKKIVSEKTVRDKFGVLEEQKSMLWNTVEQGRVLMKERESN